MKKVLQKFIADAGYCSRRKAEELIRKGQVFVDGKLAELGQRVDDVSDVVVNGKKLEAAKDKVYIAFNKPVGVTCTSRKFENEKNVFEFLPEEYGFLHLIGRLDKDSSGLVLLTNDGDLTQQVTHPGFEHEKKYLVELQNKKDRDVKQLRRQFLTGIDLSEDGIAKAKSIKELEKNIFEVVLTEGKKRQLRRMFGELGERVVDLKRISIGNFRLEGIKEGDWKKLNSRNQII